MEKLKGGIFITPKDIQVLNDCILNTAKKEHLMIRDALGIEHKKLTVKQYADYWGISFDLVVFKINEFR